MGGVIRSLTGGKPEAPQRDAELDRLISEEKAKKNQLRELLPKEERKENFIYLLDL